MCLCVCERVCLCVCDCVCMMYPSSRHSVPCSEPCVKICDKLCGDCGDFGDCKECGVESVMTGTKECWMVDNETDQEVASTRKMEPCELPCFIPCTTTSGKVYTS